jgi:hypothetical protein
MGYDIRHKRGEMPALERDNRKGEAWEGDESTATDGKWGAGIL